MAELEIVNAGEHEHHWVITGVRLIGKPDAVHSVLMPSGQRTVAAMRCGGCGELTHRVIPGAWDMAALALDDEEDSLGDLGECPQHPGERGDH